VDIKLRVSARLTRGLTRRQQRILNATLLKSLQNDPSLRHGDAAEFGEELAVAFGLSPRPIPIFGSISRTFQKVRSWLQRAPSETDPHVTRVWFITDRARTSARGEGYSFGAEESDKLTFGYSIVRLPEWHIIGRIRPRFRDKILGRSGYVVLQNRILDRSEFESELGRQAGHKDFLLFIHGYNTSFEAAMLRSAQFQTDLKIAGQVVCFSWPSRGQPWSYGRDAAICEESEDSFVDALRVLTSTCKQQNLHVLAHSIGEPAVLGGVSCSVDFGTRFFTWPSNNSRTRCWSAKIPPAIPGLCGCEKANALLVEARPCADGFAISTCAWEGGLYTAVVDC
jgi:alpha/beta hydrolase family protein DUF900